MTLLPETCMPEGPLRHQAQTPAHHVEHDAEPALRAMLYRCTGVAAFLAAAGIWLVPVMPGDAMMQLARLMMSAALLMGGGALFAALRAPEGPTIEIDTRRRLLTIIDGGLRGRAGLRAVHAIDSLSEIVLRDGLLTARDAQGRSLLALPVSDPATRSALARMLDQTPQAA